jgi:hypothetical protein
LRRVAKRSETWASSDRPDRLNSVASFPQAATSGGAPSKSRPEELRGRWILTISDDTLISLV